MTNFGHFLRIVYLHVICVFICTNVYSYCLPNYDLGMPPRVGPPGLPPVPPPGMPQMNHHNGPPGPPRPAGPPGPPPCPPRPPPNRFMPPNMNGSFGGGPPQPLMSAPMNMPPRQPISQPPGAPGQWNRPSRPPF